MPRRAVSVVIWLIGVAVAMLLATAAVGLVGDRVTSRPVHRLSQASIGATLAAGDEAMAIPGLAVEEQAGVDPRVLPSAGSPSEAAAAAGATTGQPQGAASAPGPASAPATSPPVEASDDRSGRDDSPGVDAAEDDGESSGPGPTDATVVPARVSATFAADGGLVGVTCVGGTISRDFVAPAAGFALDPTGTSGPTEVEVRFRSTGDDDDSRIRVSCSNGVPVQRED